MESLVRKYQQKYRKVEGEMKRWDELQSRLLSHFGSATSIVDRLEVLVSPVSCTVAVFCLPFLGMFFSSVFRSVDVKSWRKLDISGEKMKIMMCDLSGSFLDCLGKPSGTIT